MNDTERGRLFVVAAPSGAGKTSLVRALLDSDDCVRFSVSTTTRQKRACERDGVDYSFVSEAEFDELVARGAFLEHATVFDNRYGTTRDAVERELEAGHDVVLEIDWQGARQVRESMPDCTGIFILPPSRDELERRLRGRGQDSDEVIARRLRDAVSDMTHWHEFDYVIVNDEFDAAVDALRGIVRGQGGPSRRDRPGLAPVIERLLEPGT